MRVKFTLIEPKKFSNHDSSEVTGFNRKASNKVSSIAALISAIRSYAMKWTKWHASSYVYVYTEHYMQNLICFTHLVQEEKNASHPGIKDANLGLIECFHEHRLSCLFQMNHCFVCLQILLLIFPIWIACKVHRQFLFRLFSFPYFGWHDIRRNRCHFQCSAEKNVSNQLYWQWNGLEWILPSHHLIATLDLLALSIVVHILWPIRFQQCDRPICKDWHR